jgi:hypothetical protein
MEGWMEMEDEGKGDGRREGKEEEEGWRDGGGGGRTYLERV